MTMRATYSPDDNKLRLYSATRLPDELYERVKATGFTWAPKQDLFVSPKWTPSREDLLLDLCDDIEDEDTSLAERAEERADRFEGYEDKRSADAESAHRAVKHITSGIPMGQPILVGHHSERHARKDAERIEHGMRRAVRMWETSQYWRRRAAGALAHAKYKERADVRARRIKNIEADKRKQERAKAEAQTGLNAWSAEALTLERARIIAGESWLTVCHEAGASWTADHLLRPDAERYSGCPAWTVAQVQEAAKRIYSANIAQCERWISHCDNRLLYERALLDEQGASALLEKTPRPTQLPLCNYRVADGITVTESYGTPNVHYAQVEMTQARYARIIYNEKGTRVVGRSHRVRVAVLPRPTGMVCVFITDGKVHERPAAQPAPVRELPAPRIAIYEREEPAPNAFEAMREQLRGGGVQVVSVPQLFATSEALADRMVEIGDIKAGDRVCEPSFGTQRILRAIRKAAPDCHITGVEIDPRLHMTVCADLVLCTDWLQCTPEALGMFDVILMNPPFANAQDIAHIKHALSFLKPGGRLVAICANGARQNRELQPLVEELGGEWEVLPPGTFKDSGTSANTALICVTT